MVIPVFEFVAKYNTSINGTSVGVFVTMSRLPMVNMRQITKQNCVIALETVEKIMLYGVRVRTFLTSAPRLVS